jgi:hypothetical protein
MTNARRHRCRTALAVALISMLALSTGPLPAAAQTDQVLVGASGMQGIDLQTWATGDVDPWHTEFIDPIGEGQRLRLSRLHFDPCTGIVLHNTGGSVLLYAESSDVDYFFQGGEGSPFTTLHQGDSVAAGPVDYLTIVNGMVDSAYSVDLLVLSVVTGDSFVEVPILDRVDFPEESGCNGVNPDGEVTPKILGEGIAAEGGETLYLGSAVLLPDSTTEGWDLINEGNSFNLLILAGGMSVAGPNSGRAAWIGPGGVNSTYYNEGPIPDFPFVNNGTSPVIGLVFGTVTGPGAVWLPA